MDGAMEEIGAFAAVGDTLHDAQREIRQLKETITALRDELEAQAQRSPFHRGINDRWAWGECDGDWQRWSIQTSGTNGARSRRMTSKPLSGEYLLHITETQSEPGIQPDRMADDIGWEAMTLK